jgi:hypothetical protein
MEWRVHIICFAEEQVARVGVLNNLMPTERMGMLVLPVIPAD